MKIEKVETSYNRILRLIREALEENGIEIRTRLQQEAQIPIEVHMPPQYLKTDTFQTNRRK